MVLTNSSGVGKGKTSRVNGRKYKRAHCLGFYNPGSRNQAPWIEIVVDRTIESFPTFLTRFNVVRDNLLAGTLYHEIGHHLHETVGSAARGGEASAEDWRKRLTRLHNRRCYGYLRPVIRLIRFIASCFVHRHREEYEKAMAEVRRTSRGSGRKSKVLTG